MLSQLPVSAIKISIATLHWWEYVAWVLLNSLMIYFGVMRWSVLIKMLNASVNFFRLICIRQAGQAISFITPGPQFGGEPLQIFWLNRCGVPLQKALLSLGMDRFFEVWINFSILLCGLAVILMSPTTAKIESYQILNSLIILVIFITAIPWLLIKQPNWIFLSFKKLTSHWNHPRWLTIKNQWLLLQTDLRFSLKNQKRELTFALILSLAGWGMLIGELFLLLEFIDVHLNITEFVTLLVALRLALLLPIPGGVGTLEASVFWSFQMLNISGGQAIAFIALMRLRDVVILLVGLIFFAIDNC